MRGASKLIFGVLKKPLGKLGFEYSPDLILRKERERGLECARRAKTPVFAKILRCHPWERVDPQLDGRERSTVETPRRRDLSRPLETSRPGTRREEEGEYPSSRDLGFSPFSFSFNIRGVPSVAFSCATSGRHCFFFAFLRPSFWIFLHYVDSSKL